MQKCTFSFSVNQEVSLTILSLISHNLSASWRLEPFSLVKWTEQSEKYMPLNSATLGSVAQYTTVWIPFSADLQIAK